jgi:hypothetical protein
MMSDNLTRQDLSARHELRFRRYRCAALNEQPAACQSSRYGKTPCEFGDGGKCRLATWWAARRPKVRPHDTGTLPGYQAGTVIPELMLCPPNCSAAISRCPRRESFKSRQALVRKTLQLIWPLLPPHPTPQRTERKLILLTCTFPHAKQLLKLEHCARVIGQEPNVLWVVVEDAAKPTTAVRSLLRRSGVPHLQLSVGPTNLGGNAQRNHALQMIRDAKMEGIVYPLLFNELRRLQPSRVGVLAVRRAVFPPPFCTGEFMGNAKWRVMRVERPLYNAQSGRFSGFDAGWCDDPQKWMVGRYGPRKFCVDVGGFAFDATLLQHIPGDPWNQTTKPNRGESDLINMLLRGGPAEELQPLANCGAPTTPHPHVPPRDYMPGDPRDVPAPAVACSLHARVCRQPPQIHRPPALTGRDVYVFHNEFLALPRPLIYPPARCTADGFGLNASWTRVLKSSART